MRAARIFLGVMAGILVCYAVPFLFSPQLLGSLVQLEFREPNAYVEIRAFYGGLELGLALFFAWAAASPRLVAPALTGFTLFFGCAGLARWWGVWSFGAADASQPVVASLEVVAAGFAVYLARRLPKE